MHSVSAENSLHFEGGNVDSDPLKYSAGHEYVEFANSRQKSPLERKLVWTIDLLIVPVLSLIYLIVYLVSHSNEYKISAGTPPLSPRSIVPI